MGYDFQGLLEGLAQASPQAAAAIAQRKSIAETIKSRLFQENLTSQANDRANQEFDFRKQRAAVGDQQYADDIAQKRADADQATRDAIDQGEANGHYIRVAAPSQASQQLGGQLGPTQQNPSNPSGNPDVLSMLLFPGQPNNPLSVPPDGSPNATPAQPSNNTNLFRRPSANPSDPPQWYRYATADEKAALAARNANGSVHQLEDGSYVNIRPDGSAVPVTINGTPAVGKTAADKEPSRDDKAIAIYAKPPAQWTPDDRAYIQGYEKYVDKTKVQPGVIRMDALNSGRVVPIVDPNDPTGQRVIYVPSTQAAATGAESTQSVGFQANKNTTKSFTSGPNATLLNNINTAYDHAAQLQQIGYALKNGNAPLANRLANEYAQQTGQAAPANFQLLKTALAAEIAKTTHGGVATEKETEEISKALNAANSPDQLSGVISNARQLMASKRENLQQQYEQGVQGKPNFGAVPAAPKTAGRPTITGPGGKKLTLSADGMSWVPVQ